MNDKTRINRYLSQAGICSRREADRLVEDGKVTINGKVAQNGDKVGDDDEVTVNG
jgi:23S rRNA pseudouridine2604 synthase